MCAFHPERLSQPVQLRLPFMLRFLRRRHYLTQAELSKALNLDRSTYAYYELGYTRPPLETLVRISRAYDVSLEVLLGIDSNKKIDISSRFVYNNTKC